jgi:hypothetical protein
VRAAWLIGAVVAACSDGATYFVDPAGDDAASGRAPAAAWRTLERVNATSFRPGDQILLRAGGAWTGQLALRGDGAVGVPIELGRYGDGPAPSINGNGARAAVYLENQSHWIVRDLDVSNCVAPCGSLDDPGTSRAARVGILVVASSGAPVRDVTIAANAVHDVAGNVAAVGDPSIDSYYARNAGIAVVAAQGSTFDGIAITGNAITDVDRVGIFVGFDDVGADTADAIASLPRATNVAIASNTIDRSGGDGIVNYGTSGAVVTGNVVTNGGRRGTASAAIWSAAADRTLVERNVVSGEVAGTGGGGDRDRMAFDVDWGTTDHVVRYNASRGNYGGFLQIWESHGLPGSAATTVDGLVVEFNVSIDDGDDASTHLLTQCGTSWSAGRAPIVANNTFVLAAALSTAMIGRCRQTSSPGAPIIGGALDVYDNIFYARGATSFAVLPDATFDGNVLYAAGGVINDPAGALHDDPLLARADPVVVDDVKLRAGSPALAGGRALGGGRRDFWGNAVVGAPRGAYAGMGIAP